MIDRIVFQTLKLLVSTRQSRCNYPRIDISKVHRHLKGSITYPKPSRWCSVRLERVSRKECDAVE